MADRHVDSMENFDYSVAAEKFLKQHGLFIASAPAINHKPGNDLWSDVYYPLPTYPDTRFRDAYEENNQIKDDSLDDNNCNNPRSDLEDLSDDFEIPDEDMVGMRQNIKNPVITYLTDLGKPMIENVVHPYTGLTLQAVEKKAYDISFLKPKRTAEGRKVELHNVEMITGHLYSIATYDGHNYHIFRGLCIDILKVVQRNYNERGVLVTPRSTPWGDPMSVDTDAYKDTRKVARVANVNGRYPVNTVDPTVTKLIQRNLRIVLDVSEPFKSGMECIPVNQIIDIQKYDHIYDFTLYEGDLKIFWENWYQEYEAPPEHNPWNTYVSGEGEPQVLSHPVIEHQKRSNQK